MNPLGKPDAVNLPVRFDEGGGDSLTCAIPTLQLNPLQIARPHFLYLIAGEKIIPGLHKNLSKLRGLRKFWQQQLRHGMAVHLTSAPSELSTQSGRSTAVLLPALESSKNHQRDRNKPQVFRHQKTQSLLRSRRFDQSPINDPRYQ